MDKYLTPKQLSEILQVAEKTLANQRVKGRGVPFVKIEKAVRYRISDIEAYLSKERVTGNTERQGKATGANDEF
ncbi:TPA: helix-turn-helix domain-containing protein [Vibrio parahaemolyticus]|nr:helix-turn-helix domain-containing protein [Vibrio parahaemolyticus]HCM1282091.1 helix-turn-helix domain-containing protein [Vibrio parahaemolyticus]